MTERDNRAPTSNRRGGLPPRQAVTDPTREDLNNDQVRRWAKLIAEGDASPIAHLSADNRDRIESEIRRLLRQRLIRLVARTIAQDIVAGQNHDGD